LPPWNKNLVKEQVRPVSLELIERKTFPGTICGVLRESYRLTNNEQVKMNMRVAMAMAKKMTDRLNYYYSKEKEEI